MSIKKVVESKMDDTKIMDEPSQDLKEDAGARMFGSNKLVNKPKDNIVVDDDFKIKDINNNNKIQYCFQYINGKYVTPNSGKYFDNKNPATNKVISRVACGDKTDVENAYKAANKAFPEWKALTPEKRGSYLIKMADELEKRKKEFAILESRDNGKPAWLALLVDVSGAAKMLRHHAEACNHETSESVVGRPDAMHMVQYAPIGVCGIITPWNYPLYLFLGKIAPAIVYGNCVVAKPAELTPMTAYLMTSIFDAVKLPPGVVNVVQGFGREAGQAICEHPGIRAVSFTGGTVTGRKVNQSCATTFKKVNLEMGGKNVSIICDDVNIDEAVINSSKAGFSNQGEICICGSRIYIQDKIYDTFVKKFIEHTKKYWIPKVGNPLDKGIMMGSLISLPHRNKVKSYVEIAKNEGGTIECGGVIPKNLKGDNKNGAFFLPTVITGLDYKSRCGTEEIFGPVVTLHKFKTDDEVIKMSNCLNYGLAGSLFCNNIKRAIKIATKIETGRISVNDWPLSDHRMPFGGVKGSGVDREGGRWSRDFFTEPKHISIKL